MRNDLIDINNVGRQQLRTMLEKLRIKVINICSLADLTLKMARYTIWLVKKHK